MSDPQMPVISSYRHSQPLCIQFPSKDTQTQEQQSDPSDTSQQCTKKTQPKLIILSDASRNIYLAYNNFLNLPRELQGICHYVQPIIDLSKIRTKYLSGACSANLNILSNFKNQYPQQGSQQSTYDSKSFTDLYTSILNSVDEGTLILNSVYGTLIKNQFYLDNTDPYLHRIHTPGILMPSVSPSKTDFSAIPYSVAPSYVISSVKNISGSSNISQNAVSDVLKKWPGCAGPGILFRSSSGTQPQFICLLQCL